MAQFAQEILSTFSNSIGEVALVPSTGGVFVIDITHIVVVAPTDTDETISIQSGGGERVLSNTPSTKQITTRLWDRKVDGGFPETKTLKKFIRDIIDPSRDLGHVDGHKKTGVVTNPNPNPTPNPTPTPGNNNNININTNENINDKIDKKHINTDDIGKNKSSGDGPHDVVVLVTDQDPILSSTGQKEKEKEKEGEEEGGGVGGGGERRSREGDSTKQQVLDREEEEDDDDFANKKSGEQGVIATKESDQKKEVCDDDCA